MKEMGWTIFWPRYNSKTYIYGSKIEVYKNGEIDFENPLMPPGTIINEWFSKTTYYIHRFEPTLPDIDYHCSYEIKIDIENEDKEDFVLKIIFYDRNNKDLKSLYTRKKVFEFMCPLETYSYRIQLISAGIIKFRFKSIVIKKMG